MYTSVPAAVLSKRVRNRSRSPVEYRPSNTLPMVRRMKSCGIFARFSAQAVSSTPVWAFSTSKVKPLSVQKDFTTGQTCSGGKGTLSQR